MDSNDLKDYHNIYQQEFEARQFKPYNQNSLNFIGKQINITRNILNNKAEFEKILKTCCLINYVNKGHADYILKHKEIPIPLFTKEEIQSFTKEQIQWFWLWQIHFLTTEQIPYLTYEQIPEFTPEQIQAFTTEQIPYFTEKQLQTFTKEQIKNSPKLLLKTEELKTFNAKQINDYNFKNETLISENKTNSKSL